MTPVPPKSLDKALAHIRQGGRLLVPSYTKPILIDLKALARFDKAGVPLLREDGNGYRLTQGKGSVYLFPGQLKAID